MLFPELIFENCKSAGLQRLPPSFRTALLRVFVPNETNIRRSVVTVNSIKRLYVVVCISELIYCGTFLSIVVFTVTAKSYEQTEF